LENVGNLKKSEIGENARVGTTDQTDLFHARLVTSVEVEDGRRFAGSLIKEMTGGERIRPRRMKENFWEFEPTHKAIIVANHRPEIRGTDDGIWRRVKLVPFDVVIPEAERNEHLMEELEAEYEGILAWMVQGALEWRHLGLGEPAPIKAATQEYRDDMDVLSNFILTKCVEGPGITVFSTPLYNEYKQWADAAGEFVLSQTKFSTRLKERGYQKKETKRGNVWYGIGLRSDDPDPDGPQGGGSNPPPNDPNAPTLHPSESSIDKPNTQTDFSAVEGWVEAKTL
jgi:putative DNA primase/helicase